MKQTNDDQWLKALKTEVENIDDKAPDGALESILAGWAARKRHRRVRNVALASVLSAAAAIAVFALIPSGENQAVSAEYVAETEEAPRESLPGGRAEAPSYGPAAAATFRQSPDAPAELSELSLPGTSVADTDSSVAAPDSSTPAAETPDSKTPASETPASKKPDNSTSTTDDIAAANRYLASMADSKPGRKRLNLSFAANSGFMDNVAGSPIIVTSVIVTPVQNPDIKDGISDTGTHVEQQIFETRQIEEKTHYVFSAPVSAAISLSYDLTDRIALESGLCYTSVSSRLAMPSRPDTYSHRFIGIPLALRYSFVDGQMVSLYLKAGAMAEKCISGDSAAGKETGSIILSASAAAGVNYKLNDWLGIFAEPYLSYHFDTPGISSTIYDTAPLQPGLQAGLRLTL